MNHVLHEVQMPTWEGAFLSGKQANHCKLERHSAVICAKFGWTDQGVVWVVGSHGPKALCGTWEVQIPMGRGKSGG